MRASGGRSDTCSCRSPTTKPLEVISGGLRSGSGRILGVGFAVRAKVKDALANDADQVARGPAKLRDLAAEARCSLGPSTDEE